MSAHDWQYVETRANRDQMIQEEECSACGVIRMVWWFFDSPSDLVVVRYVAAGLEPGTTEEPLCLPDFRTDIETSVVEENK